MSEIELIGKFSNLLSDTAIEDWIVNKTLIILNTDKDKLLNKIGYYHITNIARKIMIESNIKDKDVFLSKLEESRVEAATIQNNLEALLVKAFPSLNPNYIKDLTQHKQLMLIGLAELITGIKLDVKSKNTSPRRNILREIEQGEVTLGAASITSPGMADKPDF